MEAGACCGLSFWRQLWLGGQFVGCVVGYGEPHVKYRAGTKEEARNLPAKPPGIPERTEKISSPVGRLGTTILGDHSGMVSFDMGAYR